MKKILLFIAFFAFNFTKSAESQECKKVKDRLADLVQKLEFRKLNQNKQIECLVKMREAIKSRQYSVYRIEQKIDNIRKNPDSPENNNLEQLLLERENIINDLSKWVVEINKFEQTINRIKQDVFNLQQEVYKARTVVDAACK